MTAIVFTESESKNLLSGKSADRFGNVAPRKGDNADVFVHVYERACFSLYVCVCACV